MSDDVVSIDVLENAFGSEADPIAEGVMDQKADAATEEFFGSPDDLQFSDEELAAAGVKLLPKKDVEEKQPEGEEDELEAEAESDDEVAEEQPKPQSRAQRRIQQLAEEKNAIKAELEAQRLAAVQQQQDLLRRIDEANARYQHQMDQYLRNQYMAQQRAETEREEANLTEYERDQRRRAREVEGRLESRFMEELARRDAAHKQELEALRARDAARETAAAKQENLNKLEQRAVSAVEEYLAGQEVDAALREETVDVYLSYCLAHGVDPGKGLAGFKKWAGALGGVKRKQVTATKGERVKQNLARPRASGRRRASAVPGEDVAMPSWGQLLSAGYSDYVEWEAKGRPNIS